jgi:hypothetical protein
VNCSGEVLLFSRSTPNEDGSPSWFGVWPAVLETAAEAAATPSPHNAVAARATPMALVMIYMKSPLEAG